MPPEDSLDEIEADDAAFEAFARRCGNEEAGPSERWLPGELEELVDIAQARKATSTKATYKSALKHFQEYCDKNSIDASDFDHVDATRFWTDAYKAAQQPEAKVPAWATVRVIHAAIQQRWATVLARKSATQQRLLQIPEYRMAFQSYVDVLRTMLRRTCSDLTAGTAAGTYTPAQYIKLVTDLFTECHKKTSLQFWHSVITFCHQTIGRSDDMRQLSWSMMQPPVELYSIGPVHPMLFRLDLRSNKTNKAGNVQYLQLIPSLEFHQCAIVSMARVLFYQHTLGRRSVPDPSKDWTNYRDFAVFGLTQGNGKAVTYPTLRQNIKQQFVDKGIKVVHSGHAMRAGGAQWADIKGCAASDIMRLGNWSTNVMTTSYTYNTPTDAVAAQAGVNVRLVPANAQYFQPRFLMNITEEELQQIEEALYPWLSRLEEQGERSPQPGTVAASVSFVRGVLRVLVQQVAHQAVVDNKAVADDPVYLRLSHLSAFREVMQRYCDDLPGLQQQGVWAQAAGQWSLQPSMQRLTAVVPAAPEPADALQSFRAPDDMFSGLGSLQGCWELWDKGRQAGAIPPVRLLEAADQGTGKSYTSHNANLRKRRAEFKRVITCIRSFAAQRSGVLEGQEREAAETAARAALFEGLASITYKQFVDFTSGAKGAVIATTLAEGRLPDLQLFVKAAAGRVEAATAPRARALAKLREVATENATVTPSGSPTAARPLSPATMQRMTLSPCSAQAALLRSPELRRHAKLPTKPHLVFHQDVYSQSGEHDQQSVLGSMGGGKG